MSRARVTDIACVRACGFIWIVKFHHPAQESTKIRTHGRRTSRPPRRRFRRFASPLLLSRRDKSACRVYVRCFDSSLVGDIESRGRIGRFNTLLEVSRLAAG